jgi:hypothetical protein
MNETEEKAYAFAELVRKMTLEIVRNLIATDYEQAQGKALTLMQEAIQRKREFSGKPETTQSSEGDYDLQELRRIFEHESEGD